jgi:hypothetical protein
MFDKQSGKSEKIKTQSLRNYNMLVADFPLRGQSNIHLANTNVIYTADRHNKSSLFANVYSTKWTQFLGKNEMYQVAPQINIFQKTRVLSPNQGTRFNLEAGKISVRVTYGAEMSVMSKIMTN